MYFRFALTGRLKADIPEYLSNIELTNSFGKVRTSVDTQDETVKLDVMLIIRDATHPQESLDEFAKFAKMANEVMETIIQWKP